MSGAGADPTLPEPAWFMVRECGRCPALPCPACACAYVLTVLVRCTFHGVCCLLSAAIVKAPLPPGSLRRAVLCLLGSQLTPERTNLLAFPQSQAVQNSGVIGQYLGGVGGSKKRRSTSDGKLKK